MVLRTRPEEDQWQNVADARKRKQIQDRLAQRARRENPNTYLLWQSYANGGLGRRLREARGNVAASQQFSTFTLESDGAPPMHNRNATHLTAPDLQGDDSPRPSSVTTTPSWQFLELTNQETTNSAVVDSSSNSDSEQSGALASPNWQFVGHNSQVDVAYPERSPVDTSLTDISLTHSSLLPSNINAPPSPLSPNLTLPLTVFTALFLNGQILQIQCSTIIASKSPPPTPQTPLSLRPTASQLNTVHYQWIDRLPFPKLRDSLIRLQTVLDLDEFLQDIFVAPSFEIEKGGRSWEAGKWRMAEEWRGKWGWLFF